MILNDKNLEILDFINNKICNTRKELSQKLNISEVAVSKRVKYLLENEYIILDKNKNKKTLGRTAIGLKINNELGEILGIYFAQDGIIFGVSDIDGKLLSTSKIKIIDNKEIEKLCFKEIEKYIQNYNILIIGVAMNGIVDHKNGICIYSASYNWNQKNIKKILEKKYSIPVYVDNGMNIMAYYEKKKGYQHLLIVLLL